MPRISMVLMIILAAGFIPLSAQIKSKAPLTKTVTTSPAVLTNGKLIYNKYCLACHMADGAGVQNMNPPLIKTTYVLGDQTRLVKIILDGMSEEIEINGEIYANIMPSHNFLTDQEIADVLTYVRNNFSNKAGAITPAEVKKIRAKKK